MIILTGGAGFIGSVLLATLNEEGYDDILIVDSLDSSEKWKNLAGKRFKDYIHKDHFLSYLEKIEKKRSRSGFSSRRLHIHN